MQRATRLRARMYGVGADEMIARFEQLTVASTIIALNGNLARGRRAIRQELRIVSSLSRIDCRSQSGFAAKPRKLNA